MRDRFFLHIGSTFPEQIDWLRVPMSGAAAQTAQSESLADVVRSTEGTGTVIELPGDNVMTQARGLRVATGSLAEAAREASGCQLIVLVPGTAVTLTEASIPSRQRQHILSAVPYALEDQLASDIELLHFALGPRSDAGVVAVAVVSRELMDRWLGALRSAGLEPDTMIPDLLALPVINEGWVAMRDESRLWLRQGPYAGAVVDGAEATQWLDLVLSELAEDQRPTRIRWLDCRSAAEVNVDVTGITVDVESGAGSPLSLLAANYSGDHAINLIQGEYSPREQLGRLLRPWWASAALLLAVMVFAFVQLLSQYFSLVSSSDRLGSEIEQVYRTTFPEARKIVDARAQMEQQLLELGAGGHGVQGFLPLLAGIGAPLHGVAGIDVRHASYQDGKLSLSLRIKDLQLLEQLKQSLIKDGGVSVEIQSAASRDAYVDARLLIWKQAS